MILAKLCLRWPFRQSTLVVYRVPIEPDPPNYPDKFRFGVVLSERLDINPESKRCLCCVTSGHMRGMFR